MIMYECVHFRLSEKIATWFLVHEIECHLIDMVYKHIKQKVMSQILFIFQVLLYLHFP